MRVYLPLDKKIAEIRTGPPGRRAVVGRWAVAGRRPAFSKTRSLIREMFVFITRTVNILFSLHAVDKNFS